MLATFRGLAVARHKPGAPLFTVSGTTVEDEPLTVTFSAPAPPDLPDTLEQLRIERLEDTRHRLSTGAREWLLTPRAVHLHRGVPSFYSVITPRVPPLRRQLLWRVLMALAARPLGLLLLKRLRR
jgi:hypothetical protein